MIGPEHDAVLKRQADDGVTYDVEITVRWRDDVRQEILVDGFVAVADTGPLRRIDRVYLVSARWHSAIQNVAHAVLYES